MTTNQERKFLIEKVAEDFVQTILKDHPVMLYELDRELSEYITNNEQIRNITEYLNWRIAILKRDNFKCRKCSASIKDNKGLRLEGHHAKSFNVCVRKIT